MLNYQRVNIKPMNELTWECILAEILIMDAVVGWYADTLNQGLMYQLNAVTIISSVHNWLVVWNIFYFSIYWEFHHLNWRTPSFFRGVGQPPTSYTMVTGVVGKILTGNHGEFHGESHGKTGVDFPDIQWDFKQKWYDVIWFFMVLKSDFI